MRRAQALAKGKEPAWDCALASDQGAHSQQVYAAASLHPIGYTLADRFLELLIPTTGSDRQSERGVSLRCS
jgi:hypothetical protein